MDNITVAFESTIGGSAHGSSAGPFNVGDQITVTAAPAPDYKFDHWVIYGQIYTSNPITFTVSGDTIVGVYFTSASKTKYLVIGGVALALVLLSLYFVTKKK